MRPSRGGIDRYFEAQRSRFERDDRLRLVDPSHPGMINAVATMVHAFRG